MKNGTMKTAQTVLTAVCLIVINYLAINKVLAADIDARQALEIAARFASTGRPVATNPAVAPGQTASPRISWTDRSWTQPQPELV